MKAIGVKRTAAKHTEIMDTPWAEDWKKAIICLTTKERDRPDVSHTLHVEKAEKRIEEALVRPCINPEFRKSVEERIKKMSSILGNKQVRRAWEKKEPADAVAEIKKSMKKLMS